MAVKKKYYAIKKGKDVSNLIVNTWEECKRYVEGVPSQHKSFKTKQEAEIYLKGAEQVQVENDSQKKNKGMITLQSTIPKDLYVKF